VHIIGAHIVYTHNKMCPLTECTSTVFIWNDNGSMSRNMSPNFLYWLPTCVVFIGWINYEMFYCFEKQFLLLCSAAREIPDVSSVLEFSNWLLLWVLSLCWRLTWIFCYVFFFLCFLWVLFCVLLVITACTVSQVRLVAVLTKGHWADKESRL